MGTISRDNKKKRRILGVRTKFLLSYISILAIVVLVMNTYPIIISRNIVFKSKQISLVSTANQIGIALGTLDHLTTSGASGVIRILDTEPLSRVTVVNSDYDILYHDVKPGDLALDNNAQSLIFDALNGNDAFESNFSSGVFNSGASVPISVNGAIKGAVYVFEHDADEGAIILALQRNLGSVSVILTLLTLVIGVVYSRTFTGRITKLLDGIQTVREGEYSYRVDEQGHDELTDLAEEFNSLTNRLQVNEETRRRFIADASHDLKTPLASIRLLSDSILQNEDMDTGTVHEFVTDIRNESERLARTTGQLLDLTKLDYMINSTREAVDCSSVAESAVRMLKPIAADKRIDLAANYSESCLVLASEEDIYQIVVNLTDNAIKYTDKGGSVSLAVTKANGSVSIKVSDNGNGIPDADLPYIFDRFYRVDKSRNSDAGGSGLGLSIVKSTVEKHGGSVTAQRGSNGGMIFIVQFPLYSSNKK